MADAGTIHARMVLNATQFKAELDSAKRKMTETAATSAVIDKAMSKMKTAFLAAGTGVALGLGYAVKTGMDFEAQMSRVGAIAGASESDLQRLKDTAIELGASTSKSATEVAIGMEEMAAAGFEVNEIIAAMPGIIAAAEASGEDMARVTEVVTAALNGFGLEAEEASKVADILAQAANDSAAAVNDFGYAFKYAAPWAKQLGIDIYELSSMIMVMSDAGIKGEQAGTTLRMALQRLVNPPKQAREAIEELGVSLTDANGKMRPMTEILPEVIEAMSRLEGETRTAAAAQIFGTEAASGMLNVIDAGPAKLNKLTEALRNSEGASAKAAKQMKDNLAGSVEELGGAVESASIQLYDELSPALRAVADDLAAWINKLADQGTFKEWGRNLRDIVNALREVDWAMVGTIAKFVAGATPVAVFGAKIAELLKGLDKLPGGFGKSSSGAGKFSGLLGGLVSLAPRLLGFLGPYGWLIGGLATLAGLWATNAGKVDAYSAAMNKSAVATAEQTMELDKQINRFEELRDKAGMSYNELARYIDLQIQLKRATDPETQKRLADELEKIREKSGLSKNEMAELVRLNDELAKTSPIASDMLSKEGKAIANNVQQLKAHNREMRELHKLKLTTEIQQGFQNMAKWEKEAAQHAKEYNAHKDRALDYQRQANERLQNAVKFEQQAAAAREKGNKLEAKHLEMKARTEREVYNQLVRLRDEEWKAAEASAKSAENARKKYDNLIKQLEQLKQIQLLEHGISDTSLTTVRAIEKQVAKNNEDIKALQKKREQHGANKKAIDQQIEALREENANLEAVKPKIADIEKQQKKVTDEIRKQSKELEREKKNKVNNKDLKDAEKTVDRTNKKIEDTKTKKVNPKEIESAISKVDKLNRDITAKKLKNLDDRDIRAADKKVDALNRGITSKKKKPVDASSIDSAKKKADNLNSSLGKTIWKTVKVTIDRVGNWLGLWHRGGVVDEPPRYHNGGMASTQELAASTGPTLSAFSGGIVPGYGNRNAVLLGREMVLTMQQQAKLWRKINESDTGGGGVNVGNINITLQSTGYTREDAYQIAEYVQEEIQRRANRYQRARGRR